MLNYFGVSVTFLDPVSAFHGCGDRSESEWPPSPLRMFQALVAAAASRWRGQQFTECARPAFAWLQLQPLPLIVAPTHRVGLAIRVAVPNNDMDSPASYWAKGREPKKPHRPIDLRPLKTVRPIRLLVNRDEPATIHYLWPLADGCCPHFDVLVRAARSITHLGWGVDMVAGDASVISKDEFDKLPGRRWQAVEASSVDGYRVPVAGTLDDLLHKHEAFLNRLGPDGFHPVPPLSAFRVIGYRLATVPVQRAFAAFSILKPDASGMRPFDTPRRARDVAGMLRHAVAETAGRHGWPDEQINVFVHGKTPDGRHPASGETSPDRFLYLPLPTINPKLGRVESIRRVLVAAPAHCDEEISWIRGALSGQELKDPHGEPTALLTILAGSDWVLQQYVRAATSWSTVTPVILPGHDDNNPDKAAKLLRKAFEQAGFARELVEQTEMEWRRVGFRAGVDLALRYLPPENLNNRPRYHVRVRFPHPIPGPLAIGGGRFRGFGIFAADEQ